MSSKTETNYRDDAKSDAAEMARNFLDDMVTQYIDKGEVGTSYGDYENGDSYHHETHVDKSYSFKEAAEVITQLSDYEETDNGLWEGQDMKTAVGVCAAYTYGNAVCSFFDDLAKEINRDDDLSELKEQYDGVEDTIDCTNCDGNGVVDTDEDGQGGEQCEECGGGCDVDNENADEEREAIKKKIEARIEEIIDDN